MSSSVVALAIKKARDALNSHDFPEALRHLESSRGVSSTALGKALKARCLVRYGRRDESESLACEAAKQAMSPSNSVIEAETILSACVALRQIGEDAQCIQIFEAASSAAATLAALPGSSASAHSAAISLSRGYALALLRVGDMKKLQMVSMRLSKIASAAANAATAALAAKAEFEGTNEKDAMKGLAARPNRSVARGSEYITWAVLALNCCSNDAALVDAKIPAPISITGGGRGYGTRVVFDEAVVRAISLGETMLTRALDVLEPNERSSEAIGLLVHLLVRAKKPTEAYIALVGKYAFLRDADVTQLHLPDCGASNVSSSSSSSSSSSGAAAVVEASKTSTLTTTVGSSEEKTARIPEEMAVNPPPPAPSIKSSTKTSKSKKGADKSSSSNSTSVVPASPAATSSTNIADVKEQDPFLELASIRAPRVEPIERTPDDWVNDCADGLEGRGVSPSPMVLVEFLRLVAYTLTLSAAHEEKKRGISGAFVSSSSSLSNVQSRIPPHLGICPEGCGGFPVGSWEAARHAYAILLTDPRVEEMHDDWAVHTGLASVSVHISTETISILLLKEQSNTIDDVILLLAPLIKGESVVSVTGEECVDQRLVSFLAISDEKDTSLPFSGQHRGRALVCVLYQAIRLEILHRILRLLRVSAGQEKNIEKLQSAFEKSCIAFINILSRYITSIASKPCCFLDIRQFLAPLLNSQKRDEAPPPTSDLTSIDGSSLKSYLRAFMYDTSELGLGVLSVPFAPLAAPGHSSDQSPLFPLFRFSFSVPSTLVQKLVLPHLSSLCEKSRPDAEFRAQLCRVVSLARSRAIERETSVATPKAYDPKHFDESDPHGVQSALKPAAELVLLPTEDALLHASKMRIRTYATCLQIQRFLGVLSIKSAIVSDMNAFEVHEKGLQSVISDIVEAWRCSIPLGWATVSGQHEGLEGDDLMLIAAHLLWDIGHHHLRLSMNGVEDSIVASHNFKARSAFFESAILLQCASAASPYNGQLNLALVRVNSWIAAGAQILTEYRKLRIKHISTDTLSHMVVPHLIRVSWHTAVMDICNEPCEFHKSSNVDVGDHAAVALASGNLSAVIDIFRLRERLANSATLALCRARHAGNALVTHAKSLNEASLLLRRCALTDELPDLFVGDFSNPETLIALRENEERDMTYSWDAPPRNSSAESEFFGLETLQMGKLTSLIDPSHLSVEILNAALLSPFSTKASESITLANIINEFSDAAVSGGGSSYRLRLLRRCLRDNFLSSRSHVFDVLARVTSGYVTGKFDGLSYAETSLHRLKEVLFRCGYVDFKENFKEDTLAEVRRFVFGDIFNTTLPIIDTGISFERDSVKRTCISILFYSLSVSILSAQACELGWSSSDSASACSAICQHLKLITSAITSLAGPNGLLVSKIYMPAPNPPESTCISPTGGPFYASFFPEVSFLTQHVLGPVCVAIAASNKILSTSGSAATKHPSRKSAFDAVTETVSTFNTILSSFLVTIREAKKLIDLKDEKSMTLITSGFNIKDASSVLLRSFTLDFTHDGTNDVTSILAASASPSHRRGAKKTAASSYSASLTSTTAIAKTLNVDKEGAGDAFVSSLESNLIASFQKASRTAMQAVGGAYTLALDSLSSELADRILILKTL